jgi:hypothetical protein
VGERRWREDKIGGRGGDTVEKGALGKINDDKYCATKISSLVDTFLVVRRIRASRKICVCVV